MRVVRQPGRNYGKIIIVVLVIGSSAVLFFVAATNFSAPGFPSKAKPFAEYATVVSSTFNGTEYNFEVKWRAAGNYTALYAQMTSSTNGENSAVCSIGNSPISQGETINLPFALPVNATALSDVSLSIAVRSNVNSTEFTIQFQAGNATATSGDIIPSSFACFAPSDMM